jgi:two-component system chemotaxis sensor kinase CheA
MPGKNDQFMQELLATFRSEAKEHLLRIADAIVSMERADLASYESYCESLLKELHALKGAARAVNIGALESLCHGLENIFTAIRNARHAVMPEQFDVFHQACSLAEQLAADASIRNRNRASALTRQLAQVTEQITRTGGESAPNEAKAQEALNPAQAAIEAAGPAAENEEAEEAGESVGGMPEQESESIAHEVLGGSLQDVMRVKSESLDRIRHYVEALLAVDLQLQRQAADMAALTESIVKLAPRVADTPDSRRGQRLLEEEQDLPDMPHTTTAPFHSESHDFLLRCHQAANALMQTSRSFGLLRSQLLDSTMETMLAPFSSALVPLAGLVRNLARLRSKEVALKLEGDNVQVDRRVLEVARETLVHLLTNAIDHGIETSQVRVAQGKPARGEIRITVRQDDLNRIAVTVADDGAGIDADKLVNAAKAAGMLTEAQHAALDEQGHMQLALKSGVSTSKELTQTSGRGVGLAIVAEKIASIGGDLKIENKPGKGCVFHLVLPVSLATLRGLVLRCAKSRFVLPLANVEKVVKLKEGEEQDEKQDEIQCVENREILRDPDSGRILPVIRLSALLRIDSASGTERDATAVIIAHASGSFALLIDEVIAEQEILPKSLGKQIRRMRYVAGAAQLGDQALVPILRLSDILAHGLTHGESAVSGHADASDTFTSGGQRQRRVLVVEDTLTSRMLLKHILENASYVVETAVDGIEALSKMRQSHFDAVVSDVEMPNLDGLELTKRIRASDKTAELPVVLVTTLSTPEEKQRGLLAGADAYVVKSSFDQDNLVATLSRLV